MIHIGICKRCGMEIVAPYPSGIARFMEQGYCSMACRRADRLDAELLRPETGTSAPTPELIRAVGVLREYSSL